MELDRRFLGKLDLSASADKVLTGSLDRFPSLIGDRCLRSAKTELINGLVAEFSGGGGSIAAETVTMPRRTGHGPRPTRVSTTSARVLYRALALHLHESLPEESRRQANWDRFDAFDEDDGRHYLVHLDIAACYEYIDHARLETEIITQSMDLEAAKAVTALLGEIMNANRGLPQMHWASDRFGDAYLDVLVRYLKRHGVGALRYVDDIKAGADDWDGSLEIVELTAEAARDLGLALSAEKTRIRRRATMQAQRKAEREVFMAYFQKAMDGRQDEDPFALAVGPYGELIEPDVQEPEPLSDVEFREAMMDAFWALSMDWYFYEQTEDDLSDDDARKHRYLQQRLPVAIPSLWNYSKRLPDYLLSQWAFKDPSSIRPIVQYVLHRADSPEFQNENAWATVETLLSKSRKSPWSLLWLLYAAGKLAKKYPGDDRSKKVRQWAHQRMFDIHELVRAEAAWVSSCFENLTSSNLTRLYRQASPLTQPALAAAMTQQRSIEKAVRQAIRDDGPLNRKAAEWVEGF